MSLEQALAENTAAIKELIAALNTAKPEAKAAPKAETKAEAAKPAKPAPKVEEAPAASVAQPKIDRATLSQAINKAAVVNRDEVVRILKSYGAVRGNDLKEEDYAAFIQDLETMVEAQKALADLA